MAAGDLPPPQSAWDHEAALLAATLRPIARAGGVGRERA
jgi:hypothetical protein